MVSANVPEIKPTGLADGREQKGEKIQMKTLALKSNGGKEAETLSGTSDAKGSRDVRW